MQLVEKHHSDRKQARAVISSLAGPCLLLLITVLFYWKLTLSNQYTWLESPDFANQVLPWYQFQAVEWHSGRFPLWDPYVWGGQSLIGQAQPGAAYPPNWILFLLPLKNGWIRQVFLHWYWVLIHYMGALFCYFLCRDLKRSRAASLLAAAAFGLGGYLGSTGWPQMLNGAVWAPLVFLFFLRAMRGERPIANAIFSGSCLGAAFLSGHHQVPIFITLAIGGAWLYHLFRNGLPKTRQLGFPVLFLTFLLLVSALQTLPAYEYGKVSLRWVGSAQPVTWDKKVPYRVHTEYGLYPLSVLGILFPNIHRHADPFIGVVAVCLAFLALACQWPEGMVRLFGSIALGGLLFSLASYSIFHGILYQFVPMVEKARNPSMAIFIFHFGIAVLAAYGLDSCVLQTVRQNRWVLAVIKALLWMSLIVYFMLVVVSLVQVPLKFGLEEFALIALVGLLLAGLLYGWRQDRISTRAALVLLVSLTVFELAGAGPYWLHREQSWPLLDNMSQNTDIVKFLRDKAETVRLEVDDKEIPYNFGDWHGIDVFGGYLASLTTNVAKVQANYQARMLFGVGFYIGRKPTREGQEEVFSGESGLKVYRNPEAFPRAWSVHEAVNVHNDDEVMYYLQRPLSDLRNRVFMYEVLPELEQCHGEDNVSLIRRDTNRVVLQADMRCKGMVVTGETFFPGWEATVDGRRVPIYEAYSVLRGVVVNAGQHRIEMRYRPSSVYWGASLTGLGLLGACSLAVFGRRLKW